MEKKIYIKPNLERVLLDIAINMQQTSGITGGGGGKGGKKSAEQSASSDNDELYSNPFGTE